MALLQAANREKGRTGRKEGGRESGEAGGKGRGAAFRLEFRLGGVPPGDVEIAERSVLGGSADSGAVLPDQPPPTVWAGGRPLAHGVAVVIESQGFRADSVAIADVIGLSGERKYEEIRLGSRRAWCCCRQDWMGMVRLDCVGMVRLDCVGTRHDAGWGRIAPAGVVWNGDVVCLGAGEFGYCFFGADVVDESFAVGRGGDQRGGSCVVERSGQAVRVAV